MKKLIRIIFLLLLIQYVFGGCTLSGDEGNKICTADPEDSNIICTVIEAQTGCDEKQLCNVVRGESLKDSDCQKYDVSSDNKETHTCLPNKAGTGCEEKGICSKMTNEQES